MRKLLHDYGITQDTMCVFCDNTNAISLSKYPVQHLKSKHIEIRYHFIQNLVEEKIVCLEFINIDNQRQTYSLKLLMDRGLNLCVRQLVSVWFLELYLPCDLYVFIVAYLLYMSHMFCWMMSCFFYKFLFCFWFCWSYFTCSVFECVQKFKNP